MKTHALTAALLLIILPAVLAEGPGTPGAATTPAPGATGTAALPELAPSALTPGGQVPEPTPPPNAAPSPQQAEALPPLIPPALPAPSPSPSPSPSPAAAARSKPAAPPKQHATNHGQFHAAKVFPMNAEQLQRNIRIRELKTRALEDRAVQEAQAKYETTKTPEGYRVARRNFYTLLYQKMELLDPSLLPALEYELSGALWGLEQHTVKPSVLIEDVTPLPGNRYEDHKPKQAAPPVKPPALAPAGNPAASRKLAPLPQ